MSTRKIGGRYSSENHLTSSNPKFSATVAKLMICGIRDEPFSKQKSGYQPNFLPKNIPGEFMAKRHRSALVSKFIVMVSES